MIVICKKGTKRLIKGHRYEVEGLWNDGTNQSWMEGKLSIKDIGRFSVSGFTDAYGNEVPNINIIKSLPSTTRLTFNSLKKGDIIVCKTDRYTLFAKGCMYKISDLSRVTKKLKNWQVVEYEHHTDRIKFEGINRWIKFSGYDFRSLTTEEQRENSLNSVLLGKDPDFIKSKQRKIELVPNKNVALMQTISKSILDSNRHHLSILEWAIEKIGSPLKVNETDYSHLMDMKLSDILKLIDNKGV